MDTNLRYDRAAGCLFGLAIGDALAAPVEFMHDVADIEAYFETYGFVPRGENATLYVTDDTQMALAVAEALAKTGKPYTAERVEPYLRREFVAWMDSPDNNRAPGMTCMSACRNLKHGMPWTKATVVYSKGCGANMRAQPVGLLWDETLETRSALAQLQAGMTHGHPTALAASDLTAWTVHDLATGGDPSDLPARLIDYAEAKRHEYARYWLGDLWERAGFETAATYSARGWNECLSLLLWLAGAVEKGDRETDPCKAMGEGWIAEEAFATGLLCFLLFPDDPMAALRRAAVTSGDSDSIACLTGAFAGAYHGVEAWPAELRQRIEYREQLLWLAGR